MIVVVDYGMGNLGSVMSMLRRAGVAATRSSNPADVAAASKLILPGVGAFDRGMEQIRKLGLEEPMTDKVLGGGIPILGICLGMHLMAKSSEEGAARGLGWLDANVVRFSFPPSQDGKTVKVPHVGWNYVYPENGGRNPLANWLEADSRFYFVHSYHTVCARPGDVMLTSDYGERSFVAAAGHGNVMGVQFHPEKSHRFGFKLLRSFAAWTPATMTAVR